MESGKAYIDELLLALVLGPTSLVFENHIIVPPSLDIKVLWIEQGVADGNVALPLLLLLSCLVFFLTLLLAYYRAVHSGMVVGALL